MFRPTQSDAVTYTIRVQGVLDSHQAARVTGLHIDTRTGVDAPNITTLTGALRDEAELEEVLDRLYALGLPLISIEREETDRAEAADDLSAVDAST